MSDSIGYNFADITSHNIALHFLSNNIGSTSNFSSISTPQLIQHINGNNQHSNDIDPTANVNHSPAFNHSDNHQEPVKASKSPIRIPKLQQSESFPISHHNKEEFQSKSTPMSSSRHSPTMLSSRQEGGTNLTHLSQPPYGR